VVPILVAVVVAAPAVEALAPVARSASARKAHLATPWARLRRRIVEILAFLRVHLAWFHQGPGCPPEQRLRRRRTHNSSPPAA
jgi:hypothetical protein